MSDGTAALSARDRRLRRAKEVVEVARESKAKEKRRLSSRKESQVRETLRERSQREEKARKAILDKAQRKQRNLDRFRERERLVLERKKRANDEARRAVVRRKQAEEEARAKAAKRRHLQSNPPKAQAKRASKLGFRPLAVIALNTAVRGRRASEKAALPLDDLCQSFRKVFGQEKVEEAADVPTQSEDEEESSSESLCSSAASDGGEAPADDGACLERAREVLTVPTPIAHPEREAFNSDLTFAQRLEIMMSVEEVREYARLSELRAAKTTRERLDLQRKHRFQRMQAERKIEELAQLELVE